MPEHLKPYQFPKGVSGNPSGCDKKLERRVRELLGADIDAIVYVQRCVALGMPPNVDTMAHLGIDLTEDQRTAIKQTFAHIKVRDVNEATKNLSDRGWGKAKQHVELNDKRGGKKPAGMKDLKPEELRVLAKLDEGTEGIEDEELDSGPPNGATEH